MTKNARHCKSQKAVTAKVINLVRPMPTVAKTSNSVSAVTTDPRRNHFANSNGSRWGRTFRSN